MIKKLFKNILPVVFVCILCFVVVYFHAISISGSSMLPNLHDGDFCLSTYSKNYERFDVIVFEHGDEHFIKRIIGLPGEKVVIVGDTITIDGEVLNQNFEFESDPDTLFYTKVPADCYFVLGDNRPLSLDSRDIGNIKKDLIVCKVLVKTHASKKLYFLVIGIAGLIWLVIAFSTLSISRRSTYVHNRKSEH